MEKTIKQASRLIRNFFILFWLLPLFLVLWGELGGGFWTGLYSGHVRITYWGESLTILLTALCVPLSLKLFSRVLIHKIDRVTISHALRLYVLWSGIRLFLLSLPLLSGFLTYYLTLSNKGLLCSLIVLTASLFCCPGEERLRRELHINNEQK